jgi:hypothetical protein
MSGFTPVTNAVAGDDGFGVTPIALAFVVVAEPHAHDVSERPKTSPVPGAVVVAVEQRKTVRVGEDRRNQKPP